MHAIISDSSSICEFFVLLKLLLPGVFLFLFKAVTSSCPRVQDQTAYWPALETLIATQI